MPHVYYIHYGSQQLILLLVIECREKRDGAHSVRTACAPWRMPHVYYIHYGSQQLILLLVIECREKRVLSDPALSDPALSDPQRNYYLNGTIPSHALRVAPRGGRTGAICPI